MENWRLIISFTSIMNQSDSFINSLTECVIKIKKTCKIILKEISFELSENLLQRLEDANIIYFFETMSERLILILLKPMAE